MFQYAMPGGGEGSGDHTCALAVRGNRVYCAYTGRDSNHKLSICVYEAKPLLLESPELHRVPYGSIILLHKFTSNEHSDNRPALCFVKDRLFIAWKGNGNNNLNIGEVSYNDNSVGGIYKKKLNETSDHGPALASDGFHLWLCWTGGGGKINIIGSRADDPLSFASCHWQM